MYLSLFRQLFWRTILRILTVLFVIRVLNYNTVLESGSILRFMPWSYASDSTFLQEVFININPCHKRYSATTIRLYFHKPFVVNLMIMKCTSAMQQYDLILLIISLLSLRVGCHRIACCWSQKQFCLLQLQIYYIQIVVIIVGKSYCVIKLFWYVIFVKFYLKMFM